MPVLLYTVLISSFRQIVPRHTILRAAVQKRSITAMEILKDKTEEVETKSEIVANKNQTRYKRRFLKRQWEECHEDKKENGVSEEKKACDKPFERIKRKKMAMLLGYCGVNYYGMQRNPGVPTIEEDLLKALFDAKYINEEDFMNQQNAQFQRSSRTDKGVSAARQVVSLKLPLEVKIEEINSRLPECIKVFGVKRATNKFNSKSKCNARTYSYTLPTYVFESTLNRDDERKNYRISAEKITKINEILGLYKGTKCYHNFTEKKHYQDPSSLRYMMSFGLERVFIESEMEFAELLVKGQSFMIHQIRKMVGLMIAVVRGHTDMGTMEKAFGRDKVMIPTAPGLGLLLDKVHYERYDAKFKDSHDSLTWDDEEEIVEKFKREQIFPSIIKGEIEGNSMALWLEKIKKHSYEPSEDIPDDKNNFGGDDDEIVKEKDMDDEPDASKDGVIMNTDKDFDENDDVTSKDDDLEVSDTKVVVEEIEEKHRIVKDNPCEEKDRIVKDNPCEEKDRIVKDNPCEEKYRIVKDNPCEEIDRIVKDNPCEEKYRIVKDNPCEEKDRIVKDNTREKV